MTVVQRVHVFLLHPHARVGKNEKGCTRRTPYTVPVGLDVDTLPAWDESKDRRRRLAPPAAVALRSPSLVQSPARRVAGASGWEPTLGNPFIPDTCSSGGVNSGSLEAERGA